MMKECKTRNVQGKLQRTKLCEHGEAGVIIAGVSVVVISAGGASKLTLSITGTGVSVFMSAKKSDNKNIMDVTDTGKSI